MFFDRAKLKKRAKWVFFPVVIALSLGLVFSSIHYAKAPAPVAQTQGNQEQESAKQMQKALKEQAGNLEKQVAEKPKDVTLLSQLAYVYALSGDVEKGEEFFNGHIATLEKEYEQNASDVETISALAACYDILGKTDNAMAKYQKIIEFEPDNFDVRLRIASGQFHDAKFADAEQQVKYVVDKQPDNSRAINMYAYILAAQDKYKEAVEQQQKFIDMAKEDVAVEQAKKDLAEWKKKIK